jgi:hypothetical protein
MIHCRPHFLSIAAAFFLTGCAAVPASGKDVVIDIAPSSPAFVTVAGVENTTSESIIRGEAALPMTSRVAGFTGGVEAKIDMPGHLPLIFRHVEVVPRPKPHKMGGEAYFTIHTGRVLPPGTVVHLVYRNG